MYVHNPTSVRPLLPDGLFVLSLLSFCPPCPLWCSKSNIPSIERSLVFSFIAATLVVFATRSHRSPTVNSPKYLSPPFRYTPLHFLYPSHCFGIDFVAGLSFFQGCFLTLTPAFPMCHSIFVSDSQKVPFLAFFFEMGVKIFSCSLTHFILNGGWMAFPPFSFYRSSRLGHYSSFFVLRPLCVLPVN